MYLPQTKCVFLSSFLCWFSLFEVLCHSIRKVFTKYIWYQLPIFTGIWLLFCAKSNCAYSTYSHVYKHHIRRFGPAARRTRNTHNFVPGSRSIPMLRGDISHLLSLLLADPFITNEQTFFFLLYTSSYNAGGTVAYWCNSKNIMIWLQISWTPQLFKTYLWLLTGDL